MKDLAKAAAAAARRVEDRERRMAAGPPALTYLSLGAGVQSTTLALMAEVGALPRPDVAIFADTQWEPAAVYRHLDWLEGQLSYPVVRVTAGDLRAHVMRGVKVKDWPDGAKRDPYRGIPVYTRGQFVACPVPGEHPEGCACSGTGKVWDPVKLGMARRQCTREFKIAPIVAEVRRILGVEKGRRIPRDVWVRQWTGISTDEAHRAKPAEEAWLSREYPLLDAGMSRMRCIQWLRDHGYPDPPKSSCIGCPFHGIAEWNAVRSDPAAWADAVEVDRAVRGSLDGLDATARASGSGTGATECFLHYRGIPLEEAIGQTPEQAGQLGMFGGLGNECDGVCGV